MTPAEQLRARLEEARRSGRPVGEAWDEGMTVIEFTLSTLPPTEAKTWRQALRATRPQWEAAYLGQRPAGGNGPGATPDEREPLAA